MNSKIGIIKNIKPKRLSTLRLPVSALDNEERNSPHSTNLKLALPTSDGIHLLNTDEITYCKSENNYTLVHFKVRGSFLISKTLQAVQELLPSSSFIRIHKSYLVHKERLCFIGTEHIKLEDGIELPLSRRRKLEVRQKLLNGVLRF